MKFFKNKKGSQLVEKILMTAFAVAGGGAVVVYGSNVLTNAKNTEITGILGNSSSGAVATSSSGVQLIAGHKYKFSATPSFSWNTMQKTDMEYFSCSKVFDENGIEKITTWSSTNPTSSYDGFIGYSCWYFDDSTGEYLLDEPIYCHPFLSFCFSEKTNIEWWSDDNYPRLNVDSFDQDFCENYSFEFSGTYVRQGNGPCLLDYLVEVE